MELAQRTKERKQKILDMEKQRRMQKTESEDPNLADTISRAGRAFDEEWEPVKHMNQLISLAKVQTIRDLQISEKQRILDQEKIEAAEVDKKMEKERLHALTLIEASEKSKSALRKKGAEIIIDQMKENERRKLIEQETIKRERAHVLRQIQEAKDLEVKKSEDKIRKQRELFAEVVEINNTVIQRREGEKLQDKIEDLKLLEYGRRKEMVEKQREENAIAEAAKREADVALLRSQQERLKDRTDEIDSLRAKRAMEAAERAAREKERLEHERMKKINASLAEARRIQQAERQLQLIEQARIEKAEFDRMIATQQAHALFESEKISRENSNSKVHASELRQQISAIREKKIQSKIDDREEGRIVRAQIRIASERLAKLKSEKMDSLETSGVPKKHCMNLLNYTPILYIPLIVSIPYISQPR